MSGFALGGFGSGLIVPLFWNITNKAGDTVTNPTTETFFQSTGIIPANSLNVGDRIGVEIAGEYMIPGSLGPTCRPRVYLGASVLADTGNLTVGVGTGTVYPFWGRLAGVVRSVGTTGTIFVTAQFFFETAQSPAPTTAGLGLTPGLITIDTTATANANIIRLSVIASSVASQYFKIWDIFGYKYPANSTNT